IEYTSACYYKYFSIDLDGFVDNLVGQNGAVESEEELARARALAVRTTLAFFEAAVFASPSGKQNTFAAHQLPDAILVEVRDRKIPVSYTNAFVKPVTAGRGEDLVERSIVALKEHVELITEKFSLAAAARFWFTTGDVAIADTQTCETLADLKEQLA